MSLILELSEWISFGGVARWQQGVQRSSQNFVGDEC
jgi:hypothetical protein